MSVMMTIYEVYFDVNNRCFSIDNVLRKKYEIIVRKSDVIYVLINMELRLLCIVNPT